MISINWRPTDRELRQFAGIWFPVFWAIVATLIVLRTGAGGIGLVILGVVGAMSIIGLIRPRWIRPVFVAWMCAAFPIGWAVSHFLLAAVYYLLITPLALLFRFLRRDKLNLHLDRSAASYWIPRPPAPPAARYFRQF